jgi:hypothetical protein
VCWCEGRRQRRFESEEEGRKFESEAFFAVQKVVVTKTVEFKPSAKSLWVQMAPKIKRRGEYQWKPCTSGNVDKMQWKPGISGSVDKPWKPCTSGSNATQGK